MEGHLKLRLQIEIPVKHLMSKTIAQGGWIEKETADTRHIVTKIQFFNPL